MIKRIVKLFCPTSENSFKEEIEKEIEEEEMSKSRQLHVNVPLLPEIPVHDVPQATSKTVTAMQLNDLQHSNDHAGFTTDGVTQPDQQQPTILNQNQNFHVTDENQQLHSHEVKQQFQDENQQPAYKENQQLIIQEKNQQLHQHLHKENQQQQHEENQQLRKENQQQNEENQQLRKENQQQNEENQQLRKENQQQNEENQQLRKENQQQNEENQQLRKENQQQNEENQQLRKENQQQNEENQQLRKENQQQNEENQQLCKENQQQNEENQQLRKENQQQNEENQQLCKENQQQNEENQQLRKENQQQNEENQQLRKENQQQNEENQQLRKENQQQNEENQQLRKENQQQNEENQQLCKENQQQNEQLQRIKQELHEVKQRYSKVQNENHNPQRDISKLTCSQKFISKPQKELNNPKEIKQKQFFEKNQQVKEKMQKNELQKRNQRIQEEQQSNEKGTFKESAQSHEDISHEFQKHYHHMEFEVPKDLGIKGVDNKQEFWRKCCCLYQTSFDICCDKIHSVFHEALISITRLSKEEEERGEVMFSRRNNLINVKTAYEFLLKQCSIQLHQLDKTQIVTKVLDSFNADADDHEWLHEEAETAVKICWKMQTVSPPMFLCQPTKHNESWHETHNKSWHEGLGELIYYRPVVMYSAGGIVACKGFIGKTSDNSNVTSQLSYSSTSYDSTDICKEDVYTTQIEKNAICGGCQKEIQHTQETINHNGKYWHEKCLPICSKSKNYVDINESCKSGKHHYHYDCFKCHHCHNTIPTSKDSRSLPDGRILCDVCYYTRLCSCCHNEIRSATGSHCGNCIHKLTNSICFECNEKIEVQDEKSKTTTNRGIFHKTCICDCQDAPAYNHLKICSRCNKKRY